MSIARARFALTLPLLTLVACGDARQALGRIDAGMDDAGEADAGEADTGGESGTPCGSWPSEPVGLEAHTKSTGITAKVVKVDFDPPRKFANDWVIALSDESGAPITGAVIDNAYTYMPVHLHTGGFTPTVSAVAGKPGQYAFKGIYFKMIGPWQVLFDVSKSESSQAQLVTFQVCVGE